MTGHSQFLRVRGLRLHVRVYGADGAPVLFLLHGWLDAATSFEPLVQALLQHFHGRLRVVVPDQRGFGYSDWVRQGYYWFPDYVADFDALANHFADDESFVLAGHSLGSQVASLYAGLRPDRVRRLIMMDGLGIPDMPENVAPARYAAWLDQLREAPRQRDYESFDELAVHIGKNHPRFDVHQCAWLARCWGVEHAAGRVRLLADPAHRRNGPLPYRSAQTDAVWRQVRAETLILLAEKSSLLQRLGRAELERRKACFANQRTEILDNVGHMMHVEAPERCAEKIAAFIGIGDGTCA